MSELTSRRLHPTAVVDVPLTSPQGHALPCRLHIPHGTERVPGVLMLPGGLMGARALEGPSSVITPHHLARHGIGAMVFTPSGRESAAGEEDWNGRRHQQEALLAMETLLAHPRIDPIRVLIISISFGLVLVLGALDQDAQMSARVRGVIDWEGPGQRRWFSGLEGQGFAVDPVFWEHREGVRLVTQLRCPYARLQSSWDHVHGDAPEIGYEMAEAAALGLSPLVTFNGESDSSVWRSSPLVSPQLSQQRACLLRWATELLGMPLP